MPKISDYDDCGHEHFHEFGRCLYKYTDCGPWVTAVLPDGREVYYDDKEAWELPMDTEVKCIRVGSIVEGSDVYVGPYDVEDPKEFSKTVKDIDEECTFFWRRDNLDHFRLIRAGEVIGYITCGWGEFELEGTGEKLPTGRTLAKLKKFCTNGDYCTDNGDGTLHSPDDGEDIKVPGTKLEIQFFVDDSCY